MTVFVNIFDIVKLVAAIPLIAFVIYALVSNARFENERDKKRGK